MTELEALKARLGDLNASSLSRRSVLRGGAGATLATAGMLALGTVIDPGAGRYSDGEMPPLPEGATVLASGLINPRFVTVGDDGSLYVSESGTGGDELIYEDPSAGEGGPPEATPAAMRQLRPRSPLEVEVLPVRFPRSRQMGPCQSWPRGLPSYMFGNEPTGAAGITFANGMIWLAIGGPGPALPLLDPIENENSVVSIDPATGAVTPVADIGAYEEANNPEATTVDSNLYGIAVGTDGIIHVADAGGNTVYNIDSASGELSILAVFDEIPLPEGAQGPPTLQAVPTGVVENPAGGVYVSLLSGGPFPAGAAKVLAVTEDGTVSDFATGLTMLTDTELGSGRKSLRLSVLD